MVVLGEHLLIAFGYFFRSKEIYFGDAHLLELERVGDELRVQWRPLAVSGDLKSMVARNRVAMCALDDSTAFFYGGNEFDGSRDEFYALPSLLRVEKVRATAQVTLLRAEDELAAKPKLGHAVALLLGTSESTSVVCVGGGEKSRRRLDSMIVCVVKQ